MLVLTRKEKESFLVGNDIEIKVVKIDENSIKIGIEAPKNKTILRKEVYDKVKEENNEFKININDAIKIFE